MDDLVAFLQLVGSRTDYFLVDSDAAIRDRLGVVLDRESLEFPRENIKQALADPASFGEGRELMAVGLHKPQIVLYYVDGFVFSGWLKDL